MHHVAKMDFTVAVTPENYASRSRGYDRCSLLDARTPSVHTDVGVGRLAAGGHQDIHCHSYEEAIYVLKGNPVVQLGTRAFTLQPGDYAFFPIGTPHAIRNPQSHDTHWLDANAPMPLPLDAGRDDTFFLRKGLVSVANAEKLDFTDPTLRHFGHYTGTEERDLLSQTESPAVGRASAGMDTAVMAYSGIRVKMLVDQTLGADHLNLFMVDYEVGGAAQVHDHPFEESYFFLSGHTKFELEGKIYTFGPGDFGWAGVGTTHACYNTLGGRLRWLETQAPQPPLRNAYRWPHDWEHFKRTHT
jgi:quercetin dioxygenase-like cupin family protein